MPTQTKARTVAAPGAEPAPESLSRGFGIALVLHAAFFGGLLLWGTLHPSRPHFGSQDPLAGSIQASVVHALPLATRQRFDEHSVLASEKTSPAPTPPPPEPKPVAKVSPAPPKAAPPPRRDEVLLPKRTPEKTPPPKTAATREQPQPTRPSVTPPPQLTPKATTGESSGVRMAQSVSELRNGTASITVEERAFGDRYAYYIRLISQKVNQNWVQQEADPHSSNGKRTTVTFTIDRDGTPVDAHVSQRSGSPSLDSSALRAIQRIDTFGPLPAGDHITIDFSFDFRTP